MTFKDGFFMLPQVLFTDERYKGLAAESKLLYALLSARMALSEKNGWVDKQGRTYIIYSRNEAGEKLNLTGKAVKNYFDQLIRAGLLREVNQGLGRPKLLYIHYPENVGSSTPNSSVQEQKKTDIQEQKKTSPSYIENNNIENSYNPTTYRLIVGDGLTEDERFLENVKRNCELEIWDSEILTMLEAAIDRIYYSDSLKVDGAILPRDKLRSYLTMLTTEAVIDVVNSMRASKTPIKKPINYLMSALVNAAALPHEL